MGDIGNLTRQELFAGKKLLKKLKRTAARRARQLAASSAVGQNKEVAIARAIMSGHYTLRSKNLLSIVEVDAGEGRSTVLLCLTGLPAGVPNVIGAPRGVDTGDQEAVEQIALEMLTAAFFKVEETKRLMREGLMDDIRLFRYRDIVLHVPGEMVDGEAEKMVHRAETIDLAQERAKRLDALRQNLGSDVALEQWETMSESTQLSAMISAAGLLALQINQAA